MAKTIPNEQIIAAILSTGTITGAAAALNMSARTIYDRMRDRDFRTEYAAARADILRGAVTHMNNQVAAAVDAIADIMGDKNVNPQTRLQAATTILTNAGKLSEMLDRQDNATRRAGMTIEDSLADALIGI